MLMLLLKYVVYVYSTVIWNKHGMCWCHGKFSFTSTAYPLITMNKIFHHESHIRTMCTCEWGLLRIFCANLFFFCLAGTEWIFISFKIFSISKNFPARNFWHFSQRVSTILFAEYFSSFTGKQEILFSFILDNIQLRAAEKKSAWMFNWI